MVYSDKRPVALSFDDVTRRLLAMSFDPYNCVELRWGDDRPSCPDQAAKRRWYQSEQPARGEIGRDQQGVEPVSARDVDIRGLIATMPERTPYVQYMPGQQTR